MRTIHKFPIPETGFRFVEMRMGAQLLGAQLQDGAPMLWALVDDDEAMVRRRINVVGTGWRVAANERYVATFQQAPYVWHVFDGGEA